MVEIATSLGRSGLQDWLIQRITAIVLALYLVFLVAFFVENPTVHYAQWRSLFTNPWMRYASLLALLSLMAHAWIGIWTVTTDYIKPAMLRLLIQVIIIFALLAYFVWGLQILWSV